MVVSLPELKPDVGTVRHDAVIQGDKIVLHLVEGSDVKVDLPSNRFVDWPGKKKPKPAGVEVSPAELNGYLKSLNQQVYLSSSDLKSLITDEKYKDMNWQSGMLMFKDGRPKKLTAVPEPDALAGNDWLGVGIGFGAIMNAHHGKTVNGVVTDNKPDDILATWVNIRAYPFGKWFGSGFVRKGNSRIEESVTSANANSSFSQRLSVVWSISIAETSSHKPLDGRAHSLGLGFDFSPEMTLILGAAFYHLGDDYGGGHTDPAFFVGMSLNFDAYSHLLGQGDRITKAK